MTRAHADPFATAPPRGSQSFLPMDEAAAPRLRRRPVQSYPQGGRMVLVVDDNELVVKTVEAILHRLGHATLEAYCGEGALAWLEKGHHPDLAIVDVNMPRMSAEQILLRLRALRPNLPVLFITGWVNDQVLALATDHPAVAVLAKPFGVSELDAQLQVLAPQPGDSPLH